MNPWGFGYNKSRKRPAAVMRSIHKSRDWFLVWIALLSYLIACAESTEAELEPYTFLAKKNWAEYLMEQGVDRTVLDALISSFAFQFDLSIPRSGVFLRIPPKDDSQPSVEWFCSFDIPVWYPWGEEQAKNSRLSSLAPENYELQLGTTTISKSPSSHVVHVDSAASTEGARTVVTVSREKTQPTVETSIKGTQPAVAPVGEETQPVIAPLIQETETRPAVASLIEQKIPDLSEAPTSTSMERFLASWNQFYTLRQASNRRMEQAETTLEKEKRVARERQPPTASAKVFCWVKDPESNGYIREQVSKKWRQDTLGGYSTKQARYDSFANEWDCSSEFGSDDESDSVTEDFETEEDFFIDYDRAN